MARLDYYGIEEELRNIIVSDTLADGVAVQIETEISTIEGPTVVIFLENRIANAEDQAIAAGTQTRYQLTFALWCLDVSFDGFAEAIKKRDDLVSRIEQILMKNRSIGGKVISSWLAGGEFENAQTPDQTGFVSAAEISLIADAKTTT